MKIMNITVTNDYIVTKIIPLSIKYKFDIQDFLTNYLDITSKTELWDAIFDYIGSDVTLYNQIFNLLDGANVEDYEAGNNMEILEINELLREISKNFSFSNKSTNCCAGQTGNYCSVCGTKLK